MEHQFLHRFTANTVAAQEISVLLAAFLLIYIMSMILVRLTALCALAALVVFVGCFYYFWKDWHIIGLLSLPGTAIFLGLLVFFARSTRGEKGCYQQQETTSTGCPQRRDGNTPVG